MRYARVTVKRDTQTTYVRDVPEWEIPVLEYIFEEGNVVRSGTFTAVDGDYPDAPAEFGRLVQAYGADAKTGVPHVASVYGEGPRGLRELARSIADAQREELQASRAPARSRKTVSADPLMA